MHAYEFQVLDILTPLKCEDSIKNAETRGFVYQGSLGPTRGEAFRDNDHIFVHDAILA